MSSPSMVYRGTMVHSVGLGKVKVSLDEGIFIHALSRLAMTTSSVAHRNAIS